MLRAIMRIARLFALVAFLVPAISCSSTDKNGGSTTDLDGSTNDTGSPNKDSSSPFDTNGTDGLSGDITPSDTPTSGTPVVYANTDDTLYSLDPATNKVTQIGALTGGTGPYTDLAVDSSNNVWVNSESALYSAALPSGGTGPVSLTPKTTFPTGSKFYALGFVPKDVITAGTEALIAGDSKGDLYFCDTSSGATQNLGSFGNWQSGDPNPSGKSTTSDTWTLSGDVVFYLDPSGVPRGLATVRTCYTSGGSTKCYAGNDALAEIDMNVLKSNYTTKATASVRKRILGVSGTGRLFGVGAWGDVVYGFSRYSAGGTGGAAVAPELISMGATGAGTVLQSFGSASAPDFTNGWSGAGVTTKAKISVIK